MGGTLTASGFYTGSAGEWSAAVPNGFTIDVGVKDQVGWAKAGGLEDLPNTVTGPAVRAQTYTGVTVNTTETTVAHGLQDQAGNPLVPVGLRQLAGPGVLAMTAVPDATNVYLIATVAGSYTFALEY